MILTSNLRFGSWDEAFASDAVLTAAMLERSCITQPSCRFQAKATVSRTRAARSSWPNQWKADQEKPRRRPRQGLIELLDALTREGIKPQDKAGQLQSADLPIYGSV